MPDLHGYPTPAEFAQFVKTHGDETWLLAPVLEECRCPHMVETWVPYGDTSACADRGEPCEPCIHADLLERAEMLFGDGVIGFDSTNTYLEMIT